MKSFNEEKARNEYKKNIAIAIKQKDKFDVDLAMFNCCLYSLEEWNGKTSNFFKSIEDSINYIIDKNKMNKDNVIICTDLYCENYTEDCYPINSNITIEVKERMSEDEYVDDLKSRYEKQLLDNKKQIQEKKEQDYALYLELKKKFEK